MNVLIESFSLEAGGSHYPSINPNLQQKFAELIIRRCAELANTAEPYKSSDLILQHFGMK